MRTPAERVWSRLSPEARATLEGELSPSELQTLLLDLSRVRASRMDPAAVVRHWREDRFVEPAAVDPRRLAEVAAALWRVLPADVVGLALSPVTPLGTCSAVGAADQNRVLSTVRSVEVVSDLTNVLALEAAVRRSAAPASGAVRLAAQHRVLRHQQFPPPYGSHFELFALVTSDRDSGGGRSEAAMLIDQLGCWAAALDTIVGAARWTVALTVIDEAFRVPLSDLVLPALSGHFVEDLLRRRGIGYYDRLALTIMVDTADGPQEIGDGGFVDWTARLRFDAKERCLISCVSTERLAALDR